MGASRLPVCFLFRMRPNNQNDSGWLFMSGTESQEFVADTNNLKICPLKSFCELDPSLLEVIDSPVGSVWERDDCNSPWKQVLDYEVPGIAPK
jgi:hypothetical protein